MNATKKHIIALVVAAGSGSRAGGGTPKQYRPLRGRPLLRHSLDTLLSHPRIDAVGVVINPEHQALYEAAARGLSLLPAICGGSERQVSVFRGLQAIEAQSPDYVMIHDAARPFLTHDLIDRLLAMLDSGAEGVIPVTAVTDTIKELDDHGAIIATHDRNRLGRAQTPQAFRFQPLLAAYHAAEGNLSGFTDDAQIAADAGIRVETVTSNAANEKVTTAEDFRRFEGSTHRLAVGHGLDVHRLVESTKILKICGIEFDSHLSLEGHSDADVGLHAVVDAILGALGEGDIGQHFPPSDPRWKDRDSLDFIAHCVELVSHHGGRIQHIDVTIIGERPKIGPMRNAMRAKLAEALAVSPVRINIKATTTEKLGFTGRGEGLAAMATATLELPDV